MNNKQLIARELALDIINKSTMHNQRLSDVTNEFLKLKNNKLTDKDKRFISMLIQGTIRLSGRLDWEIKNVFNGNYLNLNDKLKLLLKLGVYQIQYMDTVPEYAAVTTTVQIAKKIHYKYGGLTNAILRAIIKQENRVPPNKNSSIESLAQYYSHPNWMIKKWINQYSYNQAISIAKWNNLVPDIWFRVNTLLYTTNSFIAYLKKNNIKYKQFKYIPEFIKTSKSQNILNSRLFKDGKVTVQNPSAGLVVKLLNPKINENIIDICAAPGGKTSFIAELQNNTGSIKAYDNNKKRLLLLFETIDRLKINNTKIKYLDITSNDIEMSDKILVDVPCTGTGVMSKKADIRWRRKIDEVLEMHLLQKKILWSVAKHIKIGGIIVYSTCSLEIEENYMVINAFLKAYPNFSIISALDYLPSEYIDNKGALFTFPPKHKIDGGFAIRLKRNV